MVRALGNLLAERGCRVLSAAMRLNVPQALPDRCPDLVVVCDEPIMEALQGQQMLVNPLLIVAVLSASTEGYDRGCKFTEYRSIISFQEHVLVVQDRPHITRDTRQANGQWLRREVEGLERVLSLAWLHCSPALTEVYHPTSTGGHHG